MNKDIAIIGISGRFPKANNLEELYDNLKAGADCIGALSKERIEQTTLPVDQQYRNCGYLEDIDKFDYKFFGISLAEAKTMSPEQRILLEVTHGAIENSGYSPAFFNGSNTAIYVSIANSEYYRHASEFVPTLVTGNSPEFLVAKIARQFNLKANASSIESSCSSSLVALHTACNEVLVGDADMAVVAGVNLVLFPLFQKEFGLDLDAPDGKSKAFSEHANGMSYGEIAAAIILKPLEKALADKDIIHAIIKSTAVNNNGVQSSSITAPDSKSQAAVLKKAWIKAGIDPRELSYIEAHGSGTKLGDSLEIEALNLAFGEYTKEARICPISTIKSNTGHARSVAGLAGLFRTVLSLKHKVLFPTLHFEEPSTLIDFKNAAVYVNTEFRNWELITHKKRMAGITSIGVSGTNCHVVLEEAQTGLPEQKNNLQTNGYFHIPLSGKTEIALLQNTKALLDHISKNQQLQIEDISYTLSTGRDPYDYRRSYLVTSPKELITLLSKDVKAETPVKHIGNGKLVFIFSDSTSLTDHIIEDFRMYEAFDKSWISCERVLPLTVAALKDFAFQYSFYQLLTAIDITTDHVLPLGVGTIVQQVIDKDITLDAGLKLAKAYTIAEIQNKEERAKKLVDRFTKEGYVTFLDMAVVGTLNNVLCRYDKSDELVYFSAIDTTKGKNNFVLPIVHELYKRKIDAHPSFSSTYNSTGRKIELPTYQFEKRRCWLRDQPKALESPGTENKKTGVLKEITAGNTEHSLAEMITEVLGIKTLSIHDNFFDLGGDSLKATKVIRMLNDYFHTSLDFEDMFDFPQIDALAAFINKQINTEKKVTIIWEAILQTKNLQPADDFFELGGHSLMATTMLVALNKEFKVQLNFEDVFQHPTIEQLSTCIDEKLQNGAVATKEEIKSVPEQAHYELTYSQKRMWFLNHFEGGNSAYNNVIGVYLDGELDVDIFNRAVFSIIEQHESLRTIFKTVEEEPKQFILDTNDIIFQAEVIDAKGSEHVETFIDGIFREEYSHAFDLSLFPLFRTRLIKIGNAKHVCILNQHHIISDGWSLSVFIENFNVFYDHILTGRQTEIKPLKFQIKDYAEWQYKPYFQSILKKQESYWLQLFTEPVPTLHLPLDNPRPVVQSFEGDHVYFNINAEESEALKKIAKDNGATIFMVLLSVYTILLSKLGNSEDIAVGTPVAGRRFEGLQPLIGLFVNTIVLRNRPLSELDYTTFLKDVKEKMLQALNNQDYPYEELVKKVLKDRDTSRNPIFDTLFLLQNNRSLSADFNNIKTTRYPSKSMTTQFDLLLEAAETADGIAFDFSYSTVLFKQETILNFVTYFKNCVSLIVANPLIKISTISLLPASERKKIIVDWNDTATGYPAEETVVSLFEKQARKTPELVAIAGKNKSISYKQLDELSGKIAVYLTETKKIKQGDLVGILLEREEQLIPFILGILKTGAAYVPIDPGFPAERIQTIIADARIKTLVSRACFINNLSDASINAVNLDEEINAIEAQQLIELKQENHSENLAYVIYTSGSSGKPKGVMITHRSLINYINWAAGYYIAKTISAFPLFTSISFDLTVTSIFTPLITGNKIILYEEEEDKSMLIEKVCADSDAHIIKLTPSHLKIIRSTEFKIDPEQPIKRFIVGGEELEIKLAEDIYRKFNGRVELYNEYGPTEATVGCMIYQFNPGEAHSSVPIGKPIHNMQIYVLDKNLNPVPSGVEGELYISGDGLAKGYLFNDELTNRKFIDHPFIKNEKMYRTGDLAIRLVDGNIIFRGRMDGQAKINGYRIETGDIESKLQAHPEIREAVVIVKEKEGEKCLVAYYVAEQVIAANELQTYLLTQLPNYMVPGQYVKLNKIPLTTNGKINRSALPDADAQPSNEYVAPAGELEETMVEIWAELLKLHKKQISVTRGFFELGGNSIRVIHLINVIRKRKAVKITLREMFENATVQKLAKLITRLDSSKTINIPRVEKREYYTTSPAQQRIFYQQMLDKDSIVFNITAALQINGDQPLHKLISAFQQLINRHESLRTSFIITDDGVQQKINEEVTFELMEVDSTCSNGLESALNDFVKPYTLSEKSLFRAAVINNNGPGNMLLIDIHHIICDGLSMSILINDFKEIYVEHTLPPLTLRYIDYAQWQTQSVEKSGKQKAYWANKLSGMLPRLDLPVMQDRNIKGPYIASSKVIELKGETYRAAKQFMAAANVSDFMFLLSINYLLLHKMSGKQDIIIGTDVVGRTQPEFKDIVGTFVNILPLRIEVNTGDSYDSFLKNVKELVLEAFEHQDFQFDQMVALLDERDRMIRNPIVDIHFSMHNAVEGNQELTALAFTPIALSKKEVISQYELKIEVFEQKDRMDILFTYSNALYSDDMMEVFKNYYYNILTAVIKDSALEIENIPLESLSEAEIGA
jgi:amino acid adenylation domain-containing protein